VDIVTVPAEPSDVRRCPRQIASPFGRLSIDPRSTRGSRSVIFKRVHGWCRQDWSLRSSARTVCGEMIGGTRFITRRVTNLGGDAGHLERLRGQKSGGASLGDRQR
jgi:hypothetical protein